MAACITADLLAKDLNALAITSPQERLQSALMDDRGYKALDARIQEAIQLLLKRDATRIFQVMRHVVGQPVPAPKIAAKAAKLADKICAKFRELDDSEIAVKANSIKSSAPLFNEKPELAELVAAYATPETSPVGAAYTSFKWVLKAHWVVNNSGTDPQDELQNELNALANTLDMFILNVPFAEVRSILLDLIQHAKEEHSFSHLCFRFLHHFFQENFSNGLDTIMAFYEKEHRAGRLDVESIQEFEDLVFDILKKSAPYSLNHNELIAKFQAVFALRDIDTRDARWDEIMQIFLELGNQQRQAAHDTLARSLTHQKVPADPSYSEKMIMTFKAICLLAALFLTLYYPYKHSQRLA